MKRALLVIDVQNEYFTGRLPVSHPPGSLELALHPEVASRPRDLLLEENLPGSFTGTGLEDWLRQRLRTRWLSAAI